MLFAMTATEFPKWTGSYPKNTALCTCKGIDAVYFRHDFANF